MITLALGNENASYHSGIVKWLQGEARRMIMQTMRRFLASAWFPCLTALLLAAIPAAAVALLKPTGDDVGNFEVVRWMKIAGWAAGPGMGLLSLILMMILNGIRRIVRLRKVSLLHPLVALCGTVPWLAFGWILLDEPPFTAFARAVLEFIARPMLWGGLVATPFVLLLSIPLLFPAKK